MAVVAGSARSHRHEAGENLAQHHLWCDRSADPWLAVRQT
jgi:hypothetical protein